MSSTSATASGTRVAAIALDAAELGFIEQLIDEGLLPNLAAVRARSARVQLRNDEFYRGTSVWPAFLAGREDVAHPDAGGFDFDPSSYTSRRTPTGGYVPFLRSAGIAPITIDVPHLEPTDHPVRVSGWGGHTRSTPRSSAPEELLDQIDAEFGGHPALRIEHAYGWHRPEFVQQLGTDLREGAQRRLEIARQLAERVPDWNFLLVAMSEIHSAGESYGHATSTAYPLADLEVTALAREQLLAVYRAVDDAVGSFAAALGDDVVLVVFALHGMTTNDADLPSQVLLPELLSRMQRRRSHWRGLDPVSWQQQGCPIVVPRSDAMWTQHIATRWKGARPGQPSRAKRVGRRVIPESLLRARRRNRKANAASQPIASERGRHAARRDVDGQIPSWYRPAWPTLEFFALPSVSDSRLRVNLQGRERDGIVPAHEYARVCATLDASLRSCRDARTGEPAVQDVSFVRESSDALDVDGPDADVVVRWFPGVDAIVHPEVGTIGPFPFRRTGGHTPHGFAWLSGPGIAAGDLRVRPATDLAPTLLALLGQSIPPGIDGRPITPVATRR